MTAIYKRELKSYFFGMTGAIFVAFLLLMTGIYLTVYNLNGAYPGFEVALSAVVFVLLMLVPILTMRSLSEDMRTRTDQLLYTLPMKLSTIVLAKYFALLTVFIIPVGILCLYPLILSFYGTVNFAAAYGAIFAFFLLGASLISIGMFLSSLTESQAIAAVLTFGAFLLLYLMSGISSLIPYTAVASLLAFLVLVAAIGIVWYLLTKNIPVTLSVTLFLAAVTLILYLIKSTAFAGAFQKFLSVFQLFERLSPFTNGLFDLTGVLYFLSVSVLFVFLTVQSVEKRRWN